MSNPAFWDAFERWKIEQKIPDVPPSLQLMYLVASTTFIAHKRNSFLKSQSNEPTKPNAPFRIPRQKTNDLEIIDEE